MPINLKDLNPAVFHHKLGVGTDTPTSKLSVMDSATQSAADAGAVIDVKRGVSNGNETLSKAGIRIGNNSNFFGIYYGGSTGRFRFINGSNVEVLTLRDDGNVGIGKTDPSKKLEVNGEISAGNVMNVTSNLQNEGGKIFLSKGLDGTISSNIGNDSNKFKVLSNNGSSTSTQLCIDHTNGFMGIGTSTPRAKCVVSESGFAGLEFNPNGILSNGTKCNKVDSKDDNNSNAYVPLVLSSSKTILDGGFVGIGTQFPNSKLHVHGGDLSVHDSGGNYNDTSVLKYNSSQGALSLSSYSTIKNSSIQFETSSGGGSSEKVRIKHDGNVGIGTTNPSVKLDVIGDVKSISLNTQTIKCSVLEVTQQVTLPASTSIAGGSPVGSVIAFAGSIAPPGWLFCDGDYISKTTYPTLFGVIGYTYGGDNATYFRTPDLRGEFIRGMDTMSSTRGQKGIDPGRSLGHVQSAEIGSHSHFILNDEDYFNSSATLGNDANYRTGTNNAKDFLIRLPSASNYFSCVSASFTYPSYSSDIRSNRFYPWGATDSYRANFLVCLGYHSPADMAGYNIYNSNGMREAVSRFAHIPFATDKVPNKLLTSPTGSNYGTRPRNVSLNYIIKT